MRKAILLVLSILFSAALISGGCAAPQDTPKNKVLSFIKAVKGSDTAEIGNTLYFERLIEQKEGDAYLKLSKVDKVNTLEKFKNNMLRQLTSGNLKSLGEIEPQIEKEGVSGDNAEVIVLDSKNGKRYQFLLAKEGGGGIWKIYSIAGQ